MPDIWHHLAHGYVGPFGENEVRIVSTKRDPPKLRLAVVQSKVESNLGGFSWGTQREGDDDNQDEKGLFMGRMAANKLDGAFEISCFNEAAGTWDLILYGDPHNGLHTPLNIHAPNIGEAVPVTKLSGARRIAQWQDDDASLPLGKFIIYDTVTGTPVGYLQPLPLPQG